MTPLTLRQTLQTALLAPILAIATGGGERAVEAQGRSGGAPPSRAPAVTGVLASVDAERGAFTVERVGADVDDLLREKMKENAGKGKGEGNKEAERKGAPRPRTGNKAGDGDDGKAPDGESATFTLSSKAKIYVKFRTSPSVANNTECTLEDLEPMVGWPVSVKARGKAGQQVAYEVIAWRGTPKNPK